MLNISNDKIIEGLKDGDKRIIDLLYSRYHTRIYSFAYSLLKEKEEALDIVHEVFIKLWKKRKELNNTDKIEPLVYTITRNIIFSIFRKRASEKKYKTHILNAEFYNVNSNTENMVDYFLLKEKVDEFVSRLAPKCQKVYILSREKGMTNREISKKLGITEKTVEDHLSRALKFLRENMKNAGITGLLFWHLFIG